MSKLLLLTALIGAPINLALADTIPEQFRGRWYGFHGTVERLIITQTETVILPGNANSPRTTCTLSSVRNANDPHKGAIAVRRICGGSTYSELWAVMKMGGTDVLIVAEPDPILESISGYRRKK